MRYWLTVHWPRLEDASVQYPLRVWLQDGKESVGAELAAGDHVLVYETKYGPARRLASASGIKREVSSAIGRQGIVAVAKATGPFAQDKSFEKFEYGDGSQRWWCWHAPLTLLERGDVPLVQVNRVLGYSPKYVFRGFGAHHSGLKQITREQYSSLETLFLSNAQ